MSSRPLSSGRQRQRRTGISNPQPVSLAASRKLSRHQLEVRAVSLLEAMEVPTPADGHV
jgi:hypothetical protein